MKSNLRKEIKEILSGKEDPNGILLVEERSPDQYHLIFEDRIINRAEYEIMVKQYKTVINFTNFNNRNTKKG
jgi:hypothetical protein